MKNDRKAARVKAASPGDFRQSFPEDAAALETPHMITIGSGINTAALFFLSTKLGILVSL